MFPIVTVNSSKAEAIEPLGTKRKFWYTDRGRRLLFKAEERGTGEDWAEKIACELAGLLKLPHVHYELAMIDGITPGVICENCAPAPSSLVLGNQLLLNRYPFYPADADRKYYKVREHTVAAVISAMESVQLPPESWSIILPGNIHSALDVFIGYIMIDAWIANQDRHHENWGVLRTEKGLKLAPTFDHGASLARNLTDKERYDRLTTRDARRQIPSFARRARSAFYRDTEETLPMSTFEAWAAFSEKSPVASGIWMECLRSISGEDIGRILNEIPPSRMSETCKEFTRKLLTNNREIVLRSDGV